MIRTHSIKVIACLAGALLACDALDGSKDKDRGPTAAAEAPRPATAAAAAQPPAAGAEQPAAMGQAAPPAAAPAGLPSGRTQVPTPEEWNAVGEVTVKGSSALGCETKIVREWFRCTCRGKNDSGGTPTGVTVRRGGRGEAFTYLAGDVASLVVPYMKGWRVEAVFSWTDKSHKLVLDWPAGAPRPGIIGVFEGAASPLDRPAGAAGLQHKLCDCHKKLTGEPNCDNMMGAPDEDCERSYGGDCAALLECSRGEPGRFPRCRPGYRNAGAVGRCFKICGPGQGCGAADTCSSDWGSPPVCMSE
ncbi:MAG: hypothetical protein HY744_24150 [Deltaproteobacteria bacterium]|nr:hypothetical protein [Deltaproteobacteria bacterium]